MRKITLFFAALLISMTAFAADITGGTKLYLKPGSVWTQGNERFAAYFFNSSTNAWVGMTVEEDGSSYLAETPEGTWTNVIFCRMNGANATNDWAAKWDQTENLTYDGTNNCYSIASSSGGKGTGSWGVYAPTPTTWTVAGGSIELFGASWDTGKVENDLTEGENSVWTKFYDDVQLSAGDIEYKIAKNHAWTESYPGSNAKLNIPAAGKYDVTFTFNASTKAVSAVAEEVVEAPAITATWSIEEGAELESFTEVTITFTGVDAATTTMYPVCFYKVAADGTTTPVANDCTAGLLNRKASGASITLMVQEDEYDFCYDGKITAGNYRIVLSAGMVKFNNDNTNKNTEEYVLNFSIKGSDEPALEEIDAVYTVNPENNATVTEIREIVLNFTGYETIAVAEPDMATGRNIPTVYFEDELTGSMMPAGYIMFKADTASANGLRLYVDPAYTGGAESYATEGNYAINIPAGVVTFSDGISKAITLNYTVEAAPAEPEAISIADFLTKEVNAEVWYELTGVVSAISNTTYGNFDLIDETGTVYVYGLTATQVNSNDKSFATLGLENGDTLTLRGVRADYNGTAQVGGPAYYVSHKDYVAPEVVLPEGQSQETIDFTPTDVYANTEKLTVVDGTNISLTFAQNSGGTAPAWYTSGTAARLYGQNSLTVAAKEGYVLVSVQFVIGNKDIPSADNSTVTNGTYNYDTHTWTATEGADVTEMVLTNTKSSGHFRIQKVIVTLQEKVEEPVEPTPTIVEGTKLYIQLPATYTVVNSSVTFGEKATGGKLSPVKRGMSIGGGTTTTGTAMTNVDAENGVWEVVAPAGTSDSLFSVAFSFKGYTAACNIANLKYDGEHNLFTLSSDFAFDIRRGGTATEANGTWGVYPFPAPGITATWSIEEGAELESFTEVTITFTGVEAANTITMYPVCFYKVAADGTTTPVANDCTAGLLNRKASGASITLMVQEDEYDFCYDGKITAGNYRIVLSAGMVKFNNDNTNKNTEEYVLNFSIKGSDEPALEEIDAVYTVNPENNATVTEIREIVLNFTGYETIAVAEPDMATGRNIPTVYFEDELTGSMMPAGYIMFKADTASANGLRLYVDPAYTGGAESYATEGNYAINIPAGVVTFSDGISKAITLNYTVKAGEVGPEITEMEAKNAYAYDVKVETNDDKTAATVSYRLNAPAVAVKVYAKVEGEIVKAVEGTTICRYADGVADNLNTVEVSLEGLEEYAGKAVTFAVEVTGTLVENPTLVPVSYGFYHSQGVDVDVNPESEFFGRAYVTECAPDGIGKDYHSSITGQGLYAFDALLAPIANKDGNYGFKGGLTTDATSKDPRKVRISEDGRVFLTRQAITGVSPLVEVNPADLNANFADVFVDFTHDAETYELKTADGKYMASPNIAFDVKGQGEDLKVFMLSTTKAGIAYNPRGNFAKEYNLGTLTTWSAEPSATIDALDTLTHYTINYLGVSVEYDNEGGIWYAQYRATPKESEPTLIHVNAQGVEDYKDFTFVSRSSAIRFNNDFSLLAIAGNGGKKCTIFKVEKDAEGKPVLNKQYEFAVNGNNINDMAWDYANNLYIVNSSSELLYMYAMPRESAVVTTPAAERYSVKMPMPMEVEFENIAAIYEMGMWDMAYYESYSNYEVVALLKSQPTVVDKVVTSGMMGGNMNNYYLNDGTGVIVLQAEGDRYEPITDENWEVIGWDTISGLNIEVGKKLPVDFMANIDFKVVTDEETWLPTGEVYGAPVMTFVPKATGEVIVDEYGWETIVTESNEEFAARCEASDFVEEAVEANLDDVLANRIDYAGKLLVLDTTANYYAESNPYMGTMSAYMFWNAEEAFDVETYEEEGTTVVYVSPKYTEDDNNFAGKLFNVNGEELPEAALATAATINVVNARFDWNSIAQGQTLVVKEGWSVEIPQGPQDSVENGELVVNIYSNNGSVYVEAEAGAMIEVYTVNGLRVYAGVSNTNTTVINGLNTNIAIIRVNGETYKVFVK